MTGIIPLKQSTAFTWKAGPFVDDTDGKTAETALSIAQADIRLTKNGGDYAQSHNSAGATHDEYGCYDIPLDTTDTNTLGHLRVTIQKSGALPVWQDFWVKPANVFDADQGTDLLDVNVSQISDDADAADNCELMFDGTGYAGGTIQLKSDATLNATQGSYAPAKAGDAMALVDDAITSAKYDESTAFPVKSADTGSTALARTGADSDTLETLSDQIDGASTFNPASDAVTLAALQGLYAPAKAGDAMTLTEAYDAAKTAAQVGDSMAVSDKTGFSLSADGILAIWHQLVSEIVSASTIGKLIKDNLDAKVSEVGGGSLTAADIADAVLDEAAAGHTGVIATNLDAAVSTRSTYAGGAVASVTAGVTVTTNNDKTGYSLSVTPPTASQIDTQLSGTHGAGAWGAGATGSSTYTDTITDDDGDPLEDVQVEVYSDSDYTTLVAVEDTDVNGVFTFSLNRGTYYVRCIKSGYTFTDFSKVVS